MWFGVIARRFDDVVHRHSAADLAQTLFEALGAQDVAHGCVGLHQLELDARRRQVCV